MKSNSLDYSQLIIEVYQHLISFFTDHIEQKKVTVRNPTVKELRKHSKLIRKQRKVKG